MKKHTLIRGLFAGVIATVPLVGCERRQPLDLRQGGDPSIAEEYRGEPTAIGGGPVDMSTRIIEARCAREAACGFISTEAKWASEDACLEVVSREYEDDLAELDCEVDEQRLSECVSATREASCEAALDVVGRVPECRRSALCH